MTGFKSEYIWLRCDKWPDRAWALAYEGPALLLPVPSGRTSALIAPPAHPDAAYCGGEVTLGA